MRTNGFSARLTRSGFLEAAAGVALLPAIVVRAWTIFTVVSVVLFILLYSAAVVARRRFAAQLEQEVQSRTVARQQDHHLQLAMLGHALKGVSECVVVTDMQNTVLFVNEALERTLGYSASELIGQNIEIVRSPNNSPGKTAQILPATLAGGWTGEVMNLRKGGEEFPIWLSTSVVRNEKQEPIALIGVSFDITDRKRAERQLMEALKAAESAVTAKSQFLASMSHEIRTPMNGVIGMTELLRRTELTATQRDYVETIHASGENLLTIINDVLDFTKIESGKVDLESQPFEVPAAIEEVFKLLGPKAIEKNLKLMHIIDAKVPDYVVGDVTRFKQVLINLVGNGIKFTNEGEVRVRLEARDAAQDNIDLVCEVKDTGIGIPEDKRDRLFKAFSQVDASTSRRFGGTGLGLVISMRLVELMGGRLEVETTQGHGSTFRFSIRVQKSEKLRPAETAISGGLPVPVQTSGKLAERLPLRILVAEDNPVNRKLALILLGQMGYSADFAENGIEAVSAIERTRYDIVFMDVHMPEMDGLEASRRIRSAFAISDQPRIIAMTADVLVGDREKCLNAGMDDYIGKPIRLHQLQEALEHWGARPD